MVWLIFLTDSKCMAQGHLPEMLQQKKGPIHDDIRSLNVVGGRVGFKDVGNSAFDFVLGET